MPLPPLKEQNRIVALIEATFSRVKKAEKSLKESGKAIDKIMPAAIKQAIPTEEPLPEGWKWTKLGDICKINLRDSSLKNLPNSLEVTFVPMPAVDEAKGAITNPQVKRLERVRKGYTQFKEKDVLFAKITPCMENGKVVIARSLKNGLGFGSTEFHILRPTEKTISEYVYYFVRQPSFRSKAKMNMTGTAGQLRVPVRFMKNVNIPLPSLEEQKQIVSHLNSVSERVDKLKTLHGEARERVERIKASLLSKAFKGEI